ncbi:MAG: hypothetical protein IKA82_03280 [Clostridia bacterium]|nr:hypothetical protein [Clostridia bacterium]
MENRYFNDERINRESGKIYRFGILLATLFAAIYGAIRAFYLFNIDELKIKYLLTEGFTAIFGIFILLIGFIRFPRLTDERIAFERERYYLGGGKVFLVGILSGYALSIPYSFEKSFPDLPVNHIIIILEVFAYLYFFYCFKSREIYFNYSFIDLKASQYALTVLKNIGILAAVLTVPFLISACIEIVLHGSVSGVLSILLGYVFSVIGLGIEYGIVSLAEKLNYDDCRQGRLKRGSWIILGFLVVGYFWLCVLDVIYAYLVTHDISDVGIIIASNRSQRLYLWYAVIVLIGISLCAVLSQIRSNRSGRCFIRAALILAVVAIFWQFTSSMLSVLVHGHEAALMLQDIIISANRIIGALSALCCLALAISLVGAVGISKSLILIGVLQAISFLVTAIFEARSALFALEVIKAVVGFICLIITYIILIRHRGFDVGALSEA